MVVMPIEGPELFGEVGLPREHPGKKAAPKLTICFRERFSGSLGLEGACSLEMIVGDKELPLPSEQKAYSSSINPNEIWKLGECAWPSLIDQLVAILPDLSPKDGQAADRHILDFLCSGRSHAEADRKSVV